MTLIERLEQASGPDRELDVEIAVAVDWRWDDWEEGESTAAGQAEKHGLTWLVERSTHGMASMWRNIPRYTESLDAAMTLVPEGKSWMLQSRFNGYHAEVGWPTGVDAATPALALCIAALKASTNSREMES